MFDELLEFLQDGNPRSLSEITADLRGRGCGVSEIQVRMVLVKLTEYDFLGSFKADATEVWYLCKPVREFLKEIEVLEKEVEAS